ncbi:TonB-dependent receptor [Longitalea luteola]|uniref:TonB-dependent receptor n=1 Tax=Longitalea luteola TaxID=2812563 RepID=UPI001A968C27|nr:TonB-dependent receptor [Longitalea luteola]
MRANIVFVFIFFLVLRPASLQAQNKINIQEKDISPKKAFKMIFEQSGGYEYFYNKKVLKKGHNLSLSLNNANLEDALKVVCTDQPFTCVKREGRFYIEEITVTPRMEDTSSRISVRGFIVNEYNEAVSGIKIREVGNINNIIVSSPNGRFYLNGVDPTGFLEVFGVFIDTVYVPVQNRGFIPILVKYRGSLPEVTIRANTGYQHIQVPRATGSFGILGEMINGYANIVQTMTGNSLGLLGVTNKTAGINQPTYFTLGPRVTIHGNPDPLLVLNNFAYQGRITDINPQDIESIVFLKDAAAAAIWGARAGNGVITLTTKAGQFKHSPHFSFDAFATVGSEPDAYYGNVMSANDRIDVDTYWFGHQNYRALDKLISPAFSPVVELLIKNRKGSVSDDQLEETLKDWRLQDNRKDKETYYYRKSYFRNLSLNLSGGGKQFAYFVSGSYLDGFPELYHSFEQRKTATFSGQYQPHEKKFGLSTNISYTNHEQRNTDAVVDVVPPYARLADQNGDPLSFPFLRRQPYIDTIVPKHNLLPWNYYPLNEFRLRDKTTKDENLRIQFSGTAKIFKKMLPGLEASFYTQYQLVSASIRDLRNKHSYYVRDMVNSFTQPSDNKRPIEWGHILEKVQNKNTITDYRFQLNYLKTWFNQNQLTLITGTDKMRVKGEVTPNLVYNYDASRPNGQTNVDYNTAFTMLYNSSSLQRIPTAPRSRTFLNSFRSYYAIGNVSLKNQYHFSASARIDQSNMFGSKFKDNTIPLFSSGFAWNISSASFYQWHRILEILKFRASIGTTGNVPVNVAMYPSYTEEGYNANGDRMAIANNPPLASTKWEKVLTMNVGTDFRFKNNFLSGTLDWYRKNARDLLAYQPFDATTGNSSLTGNVASMRTDNIDLTVYSQNINRRFQWHTRFLFSFLKEKVTETKDPLREAWQYCDQRYLSIVPGKPLYGIYSFRYGGTDTATGNPIGYQDGSHSYDYSSIVKSRGYNTLRYHGRSSPAVFGSIGNEFTWRQFMLSVLVTYKLGYFYRRPSIDYDAVFKGASPPGSGDIEQRWQFPGQKTNVPSMIYPNNKDRDFLYNYSEALIQKADHFRLYNIAFSYDIKKELLASLGLATCTLYINASNLGILWRAGDKKIDPDQITGYPATKQFSFGIKGHFR